MSDSLFISGSYLVMEEGLAIHTTFVTSIFPRLKVIIATGKTGNDRVQYVELELKVFKPLTFDCAFTDLLLRLDANFEKTEFSVPIIKSIQLVELAYLRFTMSGAMLKSTLLFRRPTFEFYRSPRPDELWPGSLGNIEDPGFILQYIATILELMKRAAFCHKMYQEQTRDIRTSLSQTVLDPPALYFSILPYHLELLVEQVSDNRRYRRDPLFTVHPLRNSSQRLFSNVRVYCAVGCE